VGCCQCQGLEDQFGPDLAARELRRFRRRGPNRSTQILIDGLRAAGITGASVLDIGGGVGAIHHTLLDAGATTAFHVDVSGDYIKAARDEAIERGHTDRVLFLHGDFVERASGIPVADVATLDRVICCYPDMEALVGHAADKARRLFGAVYPPDAWWIRLSVRAINVLMRLRRSAFRAYAHSPAAIEAVLQGHGFERIERKRTFVWEIVIFARR